MDKFLCGVDLGGTKLSVGLVRETGEIFDQETMERVGGDPVVRTDLDEVKRLMIQLPVENRTLEGRGSDQSKSEPMDRAVQAFSEDRPQRRHHRYPIIATWWEDSESVPIPGG